MSLFRAAVIALVMFSLLGCALKEKSYWAVMDPDSYWSRAGFSVKAPSTGTWYKLPTNENHPNSIKFSIGDGFVMSGAIEKYVYVNGVVLLAASTTLDEPVHDRTDKIALEATLRRHLDRYQRFWPTKIGDLHYDSTFGQDCLKYTGTPKIESEKTDKGVINAQGIKGYICLHPKNDSFAVIMESRYFSSPGPAPFNRDKQVEQFFKSLRFDPISSSYARTFKVTKHQVGKSPCQIAFYEGKLWVVLQDENRIVRIDPADNKVLASIPLGKEPVALTIGEKALWVANSGDGTVTRIDPATSHAVQTIRVGGKPVAVSAQDGQVWVADVTGNAVIRITAATNSVAATIPVGKEPVSVRAGNDGIWTVNAGEGTVSIIDKSHDRISETVKVGGRPVNISLADTGAWIADESSKAVVRIDRKSRKVVSRVDVGGSPSWIRAYNGWDILVALADSAKIVRIDPNLNRVFGTPLQGEASPRSMVYHTGSIWFANSSGTTVAEVNLDPNGQLFGDTTLP